MVIWTHGFQPGLRQENDSNREQVRKAAHLVTAMEQSEGEGGAEDKVHPFRARLQSPTSPSGPHPLLFTISHNLIISWIYQKN